MKKRGRSPFLFLATLLAATACAADPATAPVIPAGRVIPAQAGIQDASVTPAKAGVQPDQVLSLKGDWRQGELIYGKAAPGTPVWFASRSVRVSPAGDFVIGLDRDAAARVGIEFTPPGGPKQRREFDVAPRTYDIQKIEGLPPGQVNPPPEALARIKDEQRQSFAARMHDTERSDFLQPFIWPATGRISGVYGSQRILNGVAKQPHYGVDVAVPTGTEVRAPAAGVVTLAAPDMYYTGGTLMIDHGHGLTSAFLHLSKLRVKEGQVVAQGEVIAESGMTGRATGPHLDWRVSWFESRVDPQRLVPPMQLLPASP